MLARHMTVTMASPTRPMTAIGAPIMALGIFSAAALQRLPGGTALVTPLALLLAAAWLGMAAVLVRSIRSDGIGCHARPLVDSFAIGTWIAATVVVGRMAMLALPDWRWPAIALLAISAALWLWFMPLALRNGLRLVHAPHVRPSGIILLTTVATQAVALLALRLFPDLPAVRAVAPVLVALGAGCYVVGIGLVITRLRDAEDWRLEHDWSNANCIIHGALSITGLALVVGDFFPGTVVLWFWAAVVAVLVVIELIELARLSTRVRWLSLRRALLVYDTSQWARNFTFGMFYAFTLAFAERVAIAAAHPTLDAVRRAVLDYGAYVVLALLLIETGLLLGAHHSNGGR